MSLIKPPIDFKIVIRWEDLISLPTNTWFTRRAIQIEEGAKALFDVNWDSSRYLVEHRRVLFPTVISRNDLNITNRLQTIYRVAFWSPLENVSLGGFSHTINRDKYLWEEQPFPKESYLEIEKILGTYVYEKKLPCTICKNYTPIGVGKFYPFAGWACEECRDSGKIPHVDTN